MMRTSTVTSTDTDVAQSSSCAPIDFRQSARRCEFLRAQNMDVHYITATDDDRRPRATALLERTDDRWFMVKGPAGDSHPDLLRSLLDQCSQLPDMTLVLLPEWDFPEVLRAAGFQPCEPFSTLLVTAEGNDEEILGRMRASARSRVRHASRFGFRFVDDPGLLDHFYPFYAASMRETNSPDFADLEFLRGLVELPGVQLFTALHGDTVAAGSICFEHRESVEARYVATCSDYRTASPLNFLHFQTICWARNRGKRHFDLSGLATGEVDEKLARVNRFKTGFGGAPFAYPSYTRR